MEEEGKDGEGKRGGAAGSGQSSGMRPNSAKDGEGEAGGGGGARGRLPGGMGGMPRSATHAGTLVRSTSASALGRGLPGSSGLVRYGSGLGFDLFGGVAGGVQFDRGRGGRSSCARLIGWPSSTVTMAGWVRSKSSGCWRSSSGDRSRRFRTNRRSPWIRARRRPWRVRSPERSAPTARA